MLDVHAPHEKMHGFRDFLLHLFTITIGLLIALSLEGCVERHQHRHLAQEAEANLHAEVLHNLDVIGPLRQQIKDEQKELDGDLATLSQMRVHPAAPHPQLSVAFGMRNFDDVTWKTTQTTGAVAYISYDDARTFAKIYSLQDQVFKTQQQVVEDVLRSASFVSTTPDNWQPTPAQVDEIVERIGLIRMRLLLLSSMVDALDKTYQNYQSGHS
jgi:hypothetical protein